MIDFILKDGKPVFIGKEDPSNPPVMPAGESSKSECEQCHSMVDYLLGDKPKVCEACYDPEKDMKIASNDRYDTTKEIL